MHHALDYLKSVIKTRLLKVLYRMDNINVSIFLAKNTDYKKFTWKRFPNFGQVVLGGGGCQYTTP